MNEWYGLVVVVVVVSDGCDCSGCEFIPATPHYLSSTYLPTIPYSTVQYKVQSKNSGLSDPS